MGSNGDLEVAAMSQCAAQVEKADCYRRTGRGPSGFEMHYIVRQCQRQASATSDFCWQHNGPLRYAVSRYRYAETPSIEEGGFKARPSLTATDCKECWATQFECPNCGPCTDAMIMTTKCCARCMATLPSGRGSDVGLIQKKSQRCAAHEGDQS